ncbi:hypothetical protein Ddye_004245 [Dipteronia dyeriana]|uniref:Uncharacterized protein n=1 Tax=Dipteronia dyeriana TaxID=168575 RepID=A0AAD9XTT3_9ROSI|nr:hypothetical protein Ddye_004245 [Dipteronia dyeriana]
MDIVFGFDELGGGKLPSPSVWWFSNRVRCGHNKQAPPQEANEYNRAAQVSMDADKADHGWWQSLNRKMYNESGDWNAETYLLLLS